MRAADPDPLPSDAKTLQAMVVALRAQVEESNARFEVKLQETLHLRTWIEKLKLEIARLRRAQFGKSSEQLSERITQL